MNHLENTQLEHVDHKPSETKYSLCFLAHDIDAPMNIGSFFRIADALGIEKIYLTGKSVVPPNNKIKKTSRSTEKFVDYSYEQAPLVIVSQLKNEGYKIVSLEITSSSIDLSKAKFSAKDKICLILGSENTGVSQELLDVSDISVYIPMLGMNSSMNVANACSIAAYEITKGLRNE